MSEEEIKLLLQAAQICKLNPADLKPVNPWTMSGNTAMALQLAVSEISPAQAARWRVKSGETASLQAAAAKAGLVEMNQSIHNELSALDPDFATGVAEAAARREADLLDRMGKEADALRDIRE